tara:strand:- start:302 stop:475 length:174 start_codon:yes stop_codon:yes gene_type:complete
MKSNGFEICVYHIPNECVSNDVKQYLLGFSGRPALSVDELWREIACVWNELPINRGH